MSLQCGQIYAGTLNLAGKTGVTVKTEGTCGKASITPGQTVSGWSLYKGNIYSAPISFTPVQLAVDGKPLETAHWPNKPQTWVSGTSSAANQLQYAMPNADLVGATLVYRPNDWAIVAKSITGYSGNTMTLSSSIGPAYDPYDLNSSTQFYVEGKLWMLDAPGEWAVSNGRIYVWTPDGQSPEGRVWAAPNADGINASKSTNVTIDGVKVFNATNGINGEGSSGLRVLNTEISNSSDDGMYVTAATGLLVDNSTIFYSGHNGINSKYNSTDITIKNSTISTTGMLGMPTMSRGGIYFNGSNRTTIDNNKVYNSNYIGIRVYKDATVSNNIVDGACLVLTDCGGIYTFARDQLPSNVRIEGNTIKNLTQRAAYAVYLDDYANGVTVTKNTITGNPSGILIHNGFNNTVTYNTFSSSGYEHVYMSENGSAASIKNNKVTNNTFKSTNGEVTYRLNSNFGSTSANNFGSYDYNNYTSPAATFAAVTGSSGTLSYTGWKSRMAGQDANSTLAAP